MSEFKAQMLGMLLVIAVFGAISGLLINAFITSANKVVTEIGNADTSLNTKISA